MTHNVYKGFIGPYNHGNGRDHRRGNSERFPRQVCNRSYRWGRKQRNKRCHNTERMFDVPFSLPSLSLICWGMILYIRLIVAFKNEQSSGVWEKWGLRCCYMKNGKQICCRSFETTRGKPSNGEAFWSSLTCTPGFRFNAAGLCRFDVFVQEPAVQLGASEAELLRDGEPVLSVRGGLPQGLFGERGQTTVAQGLDAGQVCVCVCVCKCEFWCAYISSPYNSCGPYFFSDEKRCEQWTSCVTTWHNGLNTKQ